MAASAVSMMIKFLIKKLGVRLGKIGGKGMETVRKMNEKVRGFLGDFGGTVMDHYEGKVEDDAAKELTIWVLEYLQEEERKKEEERKEEEKKKQEKEANQEAAAPEEAEAAPEEAAAKCYFERMMEVWGFESPHW